MTKQLKTGMVRETCGICHQPEWYGKRVEYVIPAVTSCFPQAALSGNIELP